MVTPVMTLVFQWYFGGVSIWFRCCGPEAKAILVFSSAGGKDHGFKYWNKF
jgi:hypothetical protein